MDNSKRRVRVIRKTVSSPSGIYRGMRNWLLVIVSLIVLAVVWRWKGENAYLRWTKGRQLDNAERHFNAGRLVEAGTCLLYTSPSPRDRTRSRMPSSA